VKAWIERHPNIFTWVVLAIGMVAVLLWSARDVGLNMLQWFWLATATVGLAGLCAWIISWEADADDEADWWSADEEEPAPEQPAGTAGAPRP
jgi:hypothetical protein